MDTFIALFLFVESSHPSYLQYQTFPSRPLTRHLLRNPGREQHTARVQQEKNSQGSTHNIHLNHVSSAPQIPLITSPLHQGITTLKAMVFDLTLISFFSFFTSASASASSPSPLSLVTATEGTGFSAGVAEANASKINPNLAIINKLVKPLIPDCINGDADVIVEFNDWSEGSAAAYPGEIRVISRILRSGVRSRWGKREVRRWRWYWCVVQGGSEGSAVARG